MTNKRNIIFPALISLLLIAGCEKLAFDPQPADDNLSVFDDVWTAFNEKYALFEFKGVDWDAMKTKYESRISNDISQDSFYNVLQLMISELRDGHSYVDGHKTAISYEYNIFYDYDTNDSIPQNIDEDILKAAYFEPNNAKVKGNTITHFITPGNIGYIRIPTFAGEIFDISDIVTAMKDTKGLILDVRHNGGGGPHYAATVASHFVDKAYDAGTDRYKIGPGANDFASSTLSISPHPSVTYTKPIAVLVSRGVFSATTKLVFYLNPAPHVSFIGSRTGGGATSPADRELANGWKVNISASEMVDFEGTHLDDGFDPDQEVWLDENNKTKDEVVEAAIAHLQ